MAKNMCKPFRQPTAIDDLREAVETLEDTEGLARRVLGGAHPTTNGIEAALRNARATLRARDTPPPQDAPRPRGGIRAPSPAFKVGDKVDARFRGWSTFYSGTIHKVHCAALYDVTYDAGYTETNVSSKFIRRRL